MILGQKSLMWQLSSLKRFPRKLAPERGTIFPPAPKWKWDAEWQTSFGNGRLKSWKHDPKGHESEFKPFLARYTSSREALSYELCVKFEFFG